MSLLGAHPDSLEITKIANRGTAHVPQTITWTAVPNLHRLTGPTIPIIGRRFFDFTPETILKLGTDRAEGIMTRLGNDSLGPVVPTLKAFISITGPPADEGILISRQPGEPLAVLWPSLSPAQRATAKASLTALLVRMRAAHERRFDYYGRPGGLPYATRSESGPKTVHDFCRTRLEWDRSRIRALRSAAPDVGLDERRACALERVQRDACCLGGIDGEHVLLVDAPVLTHGDLSDRNILVDPVTLEVTGLIDWEMANVAPAYFEYATACLSGGHLPGWRKELLEVLRHVLRIECEVAASRETTGSRHGKEGVDELFGMALATWNALVNVERPAQSYSDACYWTFEHVSQAPSTA